MVSPYLKKLERSEIIQIVILLAIATYLVIDTFGNIIAVVRIEGYIGSKESSQIIDTLDSLEKNPFVRGIVLRINSPGGTATAIHESYFKLLKVRSVKPIVTSVDDLAASGGYFLAIGTNYIIAKQSSDVGSIGAFVELPTKEKLPNIVESGPFKTEPDEQTTLRTLEFVKQDFLEAVKINRGEKLLISISELSEARIYNGFDALRLGLIDEIGGLEDAIIKAKSLAGITVYRTISLQPREKVGSPLFVKLEDIIHNTTTAPVYYHLYVQVEKST